MRDPKVYEEYEKMINDIRAKHPEDPAITEEDRQTYLHWEMVL